jgi:hypothetical protein
MAIRRIVLGDQSTDERVLLIDQRERSFPNSSHMNDHTIQIFVRFFKQVLTQQQALAKSSRGVVRYDCEVQVLPNTLGWLDVAGWFGRCTGIWAICRSVSSPTDDHVLGLHVVRQRLGAIGAHIYLSIGFQGSAAAHATAATKSTTPAQDYADVQAIACEHRGSKRYRRSAEPSRLGVATSYCHVRAARGASRNVSAGWIDPQLRLDP